MRKIPRMFHLTQRQDEALDAIKENQMIDKSKIVRAALNEYISKYYKDVLKK